jgi:Toprim-like
LDGEIVGASLQGAMSEKDFFEGLAHGSRRSQGWFYIVAGGKEDEPIQKAVLVESAIEALLYRTLYPPTKKTMILSINEIGYLPVNCLANMKEIVIGFKQDQVGEEKAQRLMQKLPQTNRQVPINKDWNADLQTYLQRLKHQLIQDKMQQIHQEESQTE